MPDRTKLQIGDSIRILKVPTEELKDTQSKDNQFPTSKVIEEIIKQDPIVIIDQIDEYGNPWFSSQLKANGEIQDHSLAIMENDSWDIVYQTSSKTLPPKEHQIAMLKKQIHETLEQYQEEYEILGKESGKLYDAQEALKEKYQNLDKKTGLNALFERLNNIHKQGL